MALRVQHSLVSWHKLIWFPKAIPKCGFILWLAIRERLGTKDRLHIADSNGICLLCNNQVESHAHLFFSCSYSRRIWDALKQKCNLPFGDQDWKDCIALMVTHCKGKSLSTLVRKLSLSASVYLIWAERNSRLHDNNLKDANSVLWEISDLIRLRLSSVTNLPDSEENRSIQTTWNLPDSIFHTSL